MNMRQKTLLDKLQKAGELLITEEARFFGVSEMTIRRDFQFLEDKGLAIRTHGGAASKDDSRNALLNFPRASDAQKRIAAEAVKFIKPRSTIMISTGTTPLQVAREVAKNGMDISVVTNSMPVASALFKTDVEVLLTGGSLRKQYMDLIGPVTEKNLGEFYIDLLITGCDGVESNGFFSKDMNLAAIEQKSVQISERVMVVTESHKFKQRSFAKYASFDDVDIVISDSNLPDKDALRMREEGIELVLA